MNISISYSFNLNTPKLRHQYNCEVFLSLCHEDINGLLRKYLPFSISRRHYEK